MPPRPQASMIQASVSVRERTLEATMDGLALDAERRDPELFEPLLVSRRQGAGSIYDAFERLRSLAKGRSFRRAHRSIDA